MNKLHRMETNEVPPVVRQIKIYRGLRIMDVGPAPVGVQVIKNGVIQTGYPLNPRYDLRNHSPDGFQWGYGGSGPSQLSLAILCDCLEDIERAQRLYQDFKFGWIAKIDSDEWTMTSDEIVKACEDIENRKAEARETADRT